MTRLLLPLSAALVLASPASAGTWVFGGSNGTNFASVTSTVPGEATLTVVARKFGLAPSSLTNISELATIGQITRTSSSIGVTGGANSQLDTNNAGAREAFVITSTKALRITGFKLSSIDINDTLLVYGVGPGGSLTSLTGPAGTIGDGLDGTAAFVNNGPLDFSQNGITTLVFNTPLAAFSKFVVTTRVSGGVQFRGDTGQGYLLNNLSAAVVPEPASWAMLIAGFGFTGAAMRRRNRVALAA
jgi:hypothetical protein